MPDHPRRGAHRLIENGGDTSPLRVTRWPFDSRAEPHLSDQRPIALAPEIRDPDAVACFIPRHQRPNWSQRSQGINRRPTNFRCEDHRVVRDGRVSRREHGLEGTIARRAHGEMTATFTRL